MAGVDARADPPFEADPEERRAVLDKLAGAAAGVPGVRLAYAFGSFARGEPFRDLDVGIVLEDPNAWRVIGRADAAIREALSERAYEVDVVPLNDATPAFCREVVTSGTLLERGEAGEYWVRKASEDIDYREWLRAHGISEPG